MKFIERTSAPTRTNKYYAKPKAYCTDNLDMFVQGGNCTDYAWCRYREAHQDMNASKNLPTHAATIFYKKAVEKGLKTGIEPKLGSIACFDGHVAFVEGIYGNKVKYSASGWSKNVLFRYLFKIKILNKGESWNGKKLQGYVYPNVEFEDNLPITGDYKVISARYVRYGAGTEFKIKKVKELTLDGQRHCTNKNKNANAQYQNGTIFTNLKTIRATNGSIWAKTPSGYVCLISSKGTVYCTKI